MQWRSGKEIRDLFIDFWISKGSKHYQSFSLVPDDPTLLFTIAGMVPFKQYYLGLKTPEHTRAVTSQKCVRTNDIENVGHTARHHTFFEMLGNFAWGDYFKKEAITWAWEFLTEYIGLDPNRLYATIYKDDEESFRIWNETIGLPEERIYRFGEDENYWFMGNTGPCGPCSEIMYDQGPEYSCGKTTCDVGCDCDRYLEIWNLVFTQYDRMEDGTLVPLPKKNIDTGMGLERLTSVVQNVRTDFETDLFMPIINAVCSMAGIVYGETEEGDLAVRVISDHLRSVAFMIADGILPANDGQGYVLRRLLRRAVRYGRLIGLRDPFLVDILPVVIELMSDPYQELVNNRLMVEQIISVEENRFSHTLEQGTNLIESEIDLLQQKKGDVLSGSIAFELYDTYGFPLELTREICEEKGLKVDEEGFTRLMTEQKKRARAASKHIQTEMKGDIYSDLLNRLGATPFTGYCMESSITKITVLLKEGLEVDILRSGEEGEVFLQTTPFYSERGGQVGDRGRMTTETANAVVLDTVYTSGELICHRVKVQEGYLSKDMEIEAIPDFLHRSAVTRNHTATHLLHEALTRVAGGHARQAGSFVSPDFLRFDFTHFESLKDDQITQIEEIVNMEILKDTTINIKEMDMESAKSTGAKALFEEKYGEKVRVVKIHDFSSELCGGIHVDSTGQIGLFKIIKEEGIGSGLRRITAVTGLESLKLLQSTFRTINNLSRSLSIEPSGLIEKVEKTQKDLKETRKELELAKKQSLTSDINDLVESIELPNGMTLFTACLQDVTQDIMREIGDRLTAGKKGTIVVLASNNDNNQVAIIAMADKEAVGAGIHAGNLLREIARTVGGGGGGRPNLAQAGGKEPSRTKDALGQVLSVVKEQLKN